uniref:Uncharacterized protein n=1 Tax=Heterorhabditis bacteriophora TaxID=37862 RepID=A0A1I7WB33_HETBA
MQFNDYLALHKRRVNDLFYGFHFLFGNKCNMIRSLFEKRSSHYMNIM